MLANRRLILKGALSAVAAMPAAAQNYGGTHEGAQPIFPPPDARSVWLVGDDLPRSPALIASRLSELAGAPGAARDGYLNGGAVEALEAAFAQLLGKQDCAFFATGTLANNVALRVLCGEDHHALCQHDSHLYRDESDAAQRLAGINLIPLAAARASPTLDELRTAFDAAENGPYALKVGAISLESPVRRLDGEMIPAARIAEIAALAKVHGARMHLDGARLLLAPPSLDVKSYVAPFETVYVSLYKYLGAPFGAVLAGGSATIAKAREYRHLYGGLIYQGWAPAMLALDTLQGFSPLMARAHSVAEELIAALEQSHKVRRRPNASTSNIHMLEMSRANADAAFERGRIAGVRMGRWQDGVVRLYVNQTISRRPVGEYERIYLG